MAFRALRARVYAPKSVDPTETTVLTPRGGASHGDAFQVANVQGLAGYQPYLDRVVGRAGAIAPLTKAVDVGALTLVLGDVRVAADATDAGVQRWLTAFAGDSAGRWQLPACRVVVEEAIDWDLDTGTTALGWQPYFVGRAEPATAQGLLRRGINVPDLSTELDQPVFEGDPHASITYAARARLFPSGAPIGWGPLLQELPVAVEVGDSTATSGVTGTIFVQFPFDPPYGTAVTRTMASLAIPPDGPSATAMPARVFITWLTGARAFLTDEFALVDVGTAALSSSAPNGVRVASRFYVRQLPGGQAVQPDSTGGMLWLAFPATTPPSKDAPIFIDDVNPVTFWRDLLDGYFGQLNATTGDPDFPVAYDASAFTALETLVQDKIDAGTVVPYRGFITERAASLRDVIRSHLCEPYNLGWRLSAEGEVVPFDLSRPTSTPSSVAITDEDLIADVDRAWWEPDPQGVGRVQVSYALDTPVADVAILQAPQDPDISPARIEVVEQAVTVVATSARALDRARKPHRIDAAGLRTGVRELLNGVERATVIAQHATQLAADLDAAFGLGPVYAVVRCARGSGRPAEGIVVGDWVTVSSVGLEDPATCERNSARLMRVVEVSDEGDAATGFERRLKCLDPGPDPVAGPPNAPTAASVLGTPTASAGVVRFTMPASNLPDFLRPRIDGGTWGADVAVTVGVGATQDVTFTGLTPGVTYAADALGVSATGVVSTSSSPDASLTTASATTIPTPTLGGSKAGSTLSLTITPGVGTPSGVTWVIERNGVFFDDTTSTSYSNLVPGGTADWTVYGTKVGLPDSLVSNTLTV